MDLFSQRWRQEGQETRLEQLNKTLSQNKRKEYSSVIKHLLEYTRFWVQTPHLIDKQKNDQLILLKEKEQQVLCADRPTWQAVHNEHTGRKTDHNTIYTPYTYLCHIKTMGTCVSMDTSVDILLYIF